MLADGQASSRLWARTPDQENSQEKAEVPTSAQLVNEEFRQEGISTYQASLGSEARQNSSSCRKAKIRTCLDAKGLPC